MPLTMRAAGLGSPVDQHRQDFDWAVGRIYRQRGEPESMGWFWSFYGMHGKPADLRIDGYAPTLEAAKIEFETAWHRWLAWAKLSER
jgi:hypothetical protein